MPRPGSRWRRHPERVRLVGGISANGYMKPKRLTIWLPKGIKVSTTPAKPCSEAFVKTLQLDGF